VSYYLRLSVTDRCNFRCVYCRPDGEPPTAGELDGATLLGLVRRIDGVWPLRKIRLTGGEPLLRPDLCELVAGLRRSFPDAELCLTTNGSRLAPRARALREAGLDRLNISLDGADARTFAAVTGGADLGAVLEGLDAARAAGFSHLRLNAVLLASAAGARLTELVRLAARHDAELRFIELMPIGPAAALEPRERLSAADALATLRRDLDYVRPLDPSATARRHLLRDGVRELVVGFIAAVSEPFCAGCDRLRLDARGRLYSCLREGAGLDLVAAAREPGGLEALLTRAAAKRPPRAGHWEPRRMVALGG
jgi:cyclic pyranopterin phosphate synthase